MGKAPRAREGNAVAGAWNTSINQHGSLLKQFQDFKLAHRRNIGCALQRLQLTPCRVDEDNVQLASHSPRNTSRVLRPAPSPTVESYRSSLHGSKYAASLSLRSMVPPIRCHILDHVRGESAAAPWSEGSRIAHPVGLPALLIGTFRHWGRAPDTSKIDV